MHMYIQISNVIYFYLEKEEDEPFPLMIQGNNTEVQCSMLGKITPTLLLLVLVFLLCSCLLFPHDVAKGQGDLSFC